MKAKWKILLSALLVFFAAVLVYLKKNQDEIIMCGGDVLESSSKPLVVFIGNSILNEYHWNSPIFSTTKCTKNGLTLDWFLSTYFLSEINHPAAVIITFGTVEAVRASNVGLVSLDQFYKDYSRLLALIQETWGNTKIIVTLAPPIDYERYHLSADTVSHLSHLNNKVRTIAKDKDLCLFDISSALEINNGVISENHSYDGIHLTESAYQNWQFYLEKIVQNSNKCY